MPCVHSRSPDLREVCQPSARSCHASSAFRPCRSSRLRRLSPPRHPAGLLHPAADHEVRPVFSFQPTFPASGSGWPGCPRVRSTLRSLPLDCSRSASPRSLPSRRSARLGVGVRFVAEPETFAWARGRPQGLAPQPSPLLRLALPPGRRPMLPWASTPCGFSTDPFPRHSAEFRVRTAGRALSREGRVWHWLAWNGVRRVFGNVPGKSQLHTPPSSRASAEWR